jgi:hypothetical protein
MVSEIYLRNNKKYYFYGFFTQFTIHLNFCFEICQFTPVIFVFSVYEQMTFFRV